MIYAVNIAFLVIAQLLIIGFFTFMKIKLPMADWTKAMNINCLVVFETVVMSSLCAGFCRDNDKFIAFIISLAVSLIGWGIIVLIIGHNRLKNLIKGFVCLIIICALRGLIIGF